MPVDYIEYGRVTETDRILSMGTGICTGRKCRCVEEQCD